MVDCPICGHQIEKSGLVECPNCSAPLERPEPPVEAEAEAEGGGGTTGTSADATDDQEQGPGFVTHPPPGGDGPGGGDFPPLPPENSVPFEDGSVPFFDRLFRTMRKAFSDPVGLFSGLQADDIGAPLVYGTIVGTVGSLFGILWNMVFGGLAMLGEGANPEQFAFGTGFYVVLMVFSPVLAAVGLFISAGLYHLALMILGDAERGFSVTFRAVAYGNTPAILGALPICGGIVGGIWVIVLVIMGGKFGHGTDTWKAVLAYFLPVFLCCCVLGTLGFMFGFLGALAQ